MTTGEFTASPEDPILSISETALFGLARQVKMTEDAVDANRQALAGNHPTLAAMADYHAQEIDALYGNSDMAKGFRIGTYTSYGLLQLVSHATNTPLPVETISGNLEDAASNYERSELTVEKQRTAEERNARGELQPDDFLSAATNVREFAKKYPQYYTVALMYGARLTKRPVSYYERFLQTGNPESTITSLGKTGIMSVQVRENYTFTAFLHGFTGLASLLLERRQRDTFYKQFGFSAE